MKPDEAKETFEEDGKRIPRFLLVTFKYLEILSRLKWP
jgi:hypothetical protein